MGREFAVSVGTLLWLVAAGFGFWAWDRYEATPAPIGPAPVARARATGSWEVTLFVHPHCPCARGALAALGDLAREAPALVVRVAFVRPPGAPTGWERSASWRAAESVPRASVVCDADGVGATRAGAATSGVAVLSDPTGRVAFRGGLTPRPGHGGDAPGARAVRAWLSGETGPASAPVFGCPLFD